MKCVCVRNHPRSNPRPQHCHSTHLPYGHRNQPPQNFTPLSNGELEVRDSRVAFPNSHSYIGVWTRVGQISKPTLLPRNPIHLWTPVYMESIPMISSEQTRARWGCSRSDFSPEGSGECQEGPVTESELPLPTRKFLGLRSRSERRPASKGLPGTKDQVIQNGVIGSIWPT